MDDLDATKVRLKLQQDSYDELHQECQMLREETGSLNKEVVSLDKEYKAHVQQSESMIKQQSEISTSLKKELEDKSAKIDLARKDSNAMAVSLGKELDEAKVSIQMLKATVDSQKKVISTHEETSKLAMFWKNKYTHESSKNEELTSRLTSIRDALLEPRAQDTPSKQADPAKPTVVWKDSNSNAVGTLKPVTCELQDSKSVDPQPKFTYQLKTPYVLSEELLRSIYGWSELGPSKVECTMCQGRQYLVNRVEGSDPYYMHEVCPKCCPPKPNQSTPAKEEKLGGIKP